MELRRVPLRASATADPPNPRPFPRRNHDQRTAHVAVNLYLQRETSAVPSDRFRPALRAIVHQQGGFRRIARCASNEHRAKDRLYLAINAGQPPSPLVVRAAYRLQVARHGEPQRVPVLVGAVARVHSSLEGELSHLDLFGSGSGK